MKRYTLLLVIGVLLALVAALAGGAAAEPAADGSVTLTGVLTVVHEDDWNGAPLPPRFFLHQADAEQAVELTAAGVDLSSLDRQRVTVTVDGIVNAAAVVREATASSGADATVSALVGNSKWITLACQFPDVAGQPKTTAYLRDMYRNEFPGLDHYWRAASLGNLTLADSTAAGWYTYPQLQQAYTGLPLSELLDRLLKDCVAQADPYVNFLEYDGINLALNTDMGNPRGGGWSLTVEGVTRTYRTTWLPPWAYANMAITQHEMGHGFGMPHSAGATGDEYGNYWDVMARVSSNCAGQPWRDPVYGCIGQLPITFQRDLAGWLDGRVYEAGSGEHHVLLRSATQPGADGYMMIRIPIDGSARHYYTVEARELVGYDRAVPDAGIILFDVNLDRYPRAWVVAPCEPTSFCDGSTERDIVRPGETFVPGLGNITLRVDRKTDSGYELTIVNGGALEHVELVPTADTYVADAQPTTNFGTRLRLLVGNDPATTAFLQFGQLPDAIASVHLRLCPLVALTEAQGIVMATGSYYRDTTIRWTETGLTAANAPSGNDGGWERFWPTLEGGCVDWNLWTTQFWTTEYQTLVVGREGMSVPFSSREGIAPPRLIVDYLTLPPPDEPTVATFTPTNDAYVMQARPKAVYGTKAVLQVKDAAADVNTYLKFNVSGLSGVQSATLRLFVRDPGPDGGKVYTVSSFYKGTTTLWLETGLKWNNAPPIAGAPLDAAGRVVLGQWVELDVTSAVVAALADRGRVSLVLTNDSRNLVSYSSKEGAHPPELIVITN